MFVQSLYQVLVFINNSLCLNERWLWFKWGFTPNQEVRYIPRELNTCSSFWPLSPYLIFTENTLLWNPTSSDKSNLFQMKSEIFFLAIYFTEAVLKITSKGFFFGKGAYLKDNWNKLDLFVVVAGYKTKSLFIYQSIYMYQTMNSEKSVGKIFYIKLKLFVTCWSWNKIYFLTTPEEVCFK